MVTEFWSRRERRDELVEMDEYAAEPAPHEALPTPGSRHAGCGGASSRLNSAVVSAELELGAAAEFMESGGDAGASKALAWCPVVSMTQDGGTSGWAAAGHGGASAAATAGEGSNSCRSSATKTLLSSSLYSTAAQLQSFAQKEEGESRNGPGSQ